MPNETETVDTTSAGSAPKKKTPLLAIGLIGGIAAVQVAGFFVLMKFFYATPAPTYGQGGEQAIATSEPASQDADAAGAAAGKHDATGQHASADTHGAKTSGPLTELPGAPTVEIELAKKYRVPNNSRGIAYLYDFDIAMVVESSRREQAAALVAANQAKILDRIGQIVRAAPARILDEPDFRSLRLQMRGALHEIFNDESIVQQVLIPRCLPMRTD